jgi:signal transduction histidine kinase
MRGGRTRYGFPVILYLWIVGFTGIAIILYCSKSSPFPPQPATWTALSIFLVMHVIASILHFQYNRMNVVITFESAFTTATLLSFGALPAVWLASIGILFGSVKRVIERRWFLHKPIPPWFDFGTIAFNCGMIGTMWIVAGWIYVLLMRSEVPLIHLTIRNIACIILMFVGLSFLNHLFLFFSSYLQGQPTMDFLKKGTLPAFFTEFAVIPLGVVMAIAYNRMGTVAFLFLSSTLLLSNLVLRKLSLIQNDLEEKLRQLTALNRVSRKIISVQKEDEIMNLLFEELSSVTETDFWFFARVDDQKNLHIVKEKQNVDDSLLELAGHVVQSTQPLWIANAKRHAPEKLRESLVGAGIRSCIVVPLLIGKKAHGVLVVYSSEVAAFKHEHMQVLIMVADEAALALENSILYNALTDKVQELERVNMELRQLDRMKSQFLANVSHELRTPLTSIKGYVEYIKKEKLGPITPMQNEGLNVAQRNIMRLQRLIHDLLEYTKLEFKKSRIQIRPCRFDDLWLEATQEFSEIIEKRQIRMQLTLAPDLPLLFVDAERFGQVISNLMSNAIKFSDDQGAITVCAQAIHHPGPFYNAEAYSKCRLRESIVPVEIRISDEGIGIPQELLPRIFERFYQVDSSSTRKYGGTGLGLALVKSILEAHGIPIDVQSKVGHGTTIGMVVPGIQATDTAAILHSELIDNGPASKYLT